MNASDFANICLPLNALAPLIVTPSTLTPSTPCCAFREDDSRIREHNLAENATVLRHIAIGLLKADRKTKLGIKNKRLKAGWGERYLAKLLFKEPG